MSDEFDKIPYLYYGNESELDLSFEIIADGK
jgi:hypothetical protein